MIVRVKILALRYNEKLTTSRSTQSVVQVISLCNEWINYDNVYRAKFSALTIPELVQAYDNLARFDMTSTYYIFEEKNYFLLLEFLYDIYLRPDKYAAMCVDARQELDLKIGVAFSRLMTKAYLDMAREKFRLKDQKVGHMLHL